MAAILCAAALSCSLEVEPADFRGTWPGYLSDSASPSPATPASLELSQTGPRVTGTVAGRPLTGTVDGHRISFSLALHDACGSVATGWGRLDRQPARDRIRLDFSGTSSCRGTFAGTGSFERMHCPEPTEECGVDYTTELSAYCADLTSDPDNCGACRLRCHGKCVKGTCDLPVCGGPVPLERAQPVPTGSLLWALVLGDVDGDGRPDAILSGFREADAAWVIVVLRNDGQGGFAPPSATVLSSLFPGEQLYTPSALSLADLDGDGRADLAAYVGSPGWSDPMSEGALLTLLGNGDGTFRPGERFPTGRDDPLMYLGVRVLAVADLNGDGRSDVAARSGLSPAVQVRLGRGVGTLGPMAEYALAYPVDAIAAADLDGDGAIDLAVASNGDPFTSNPPLTVLPGNGDGTFQAPVESAGVPFPQDIAAADVDEDGTPDLLVIGWWSFAAHGVPNVSALLGNGDGTFRAPVPVEQEPWSFTWSLSISDLDADGHLDLAVGDDDRGLELFLGRGDATFGPFEHPVADGAGLVAAADLDHDGRIDLVAADKGGRGTVMALRACAP